MELFKHSSWTRNHSVWGDLFRLYVSREIFDDIIESWGKSKRQRRQMRRLWMWSCRYCNVFSFFFYLLLNENDGDYLDHYFSHTLRHFKLNRLQPQSILSRFVALSSLSLSIARIKWNRWVGVSSFSCVLFSLFSFLNPTSKSTIFFVFHVPISLSLILSNFAISPTP